MSRALEVLQKLGVDVTDPVAVARHIGTMPRTGKEKFQLLKDYLLEVRRSLTPEIFKEAESYVLPQR